MRSIFKYSILLGLSGLLAVIVWPAFGQPDPLDSLSPSPDAPLPQSLDTATTGKKKFLSGVEISVDYGKLLLIPSKFEDKMEFGLNIRFYEHFILAAEYGMATLDPLKAYDNAIYYNVKGSYFRGGLDYALPVDTKNSLYFGFRYGASQFEDRGKILIDSEFWPDYEEEFGDADLTASWYELIFGSETQLLIGKSESRIFIQNLFLGWKFRFRILGTFDNREEPRVYAIPGYGRTFDKTIPALNFYIKYRFGK